MSNSDNDNNKFYVPNFLKIKITYTQIYYTVWEIGRYRRNLFQGSQLRSISSQGFRKASKWKTGKGYNLDDVDLG